MTAEEAAKWLDAQADGQSYLPDLSIRIRECAALIRRQADDLAAIEVVFKNHAEDFVGHREVPTQGWFSDDGENLVPHATLADACRAANGDD